jgi:hypothetical protein
MNIIQVPLKNEETRPAFDEIPEGMQNFYPGQRVLTAYDFNNPNETSIYFKKKHEPGESKWPEGGFECTDLGGGFRAFYLDAVIIHPSQVKTSQYFAKGKSKRGRPKREVINIDGSDIVEIKKTGQRGRPRKYVEGESPSTLAKQAKILENNGEVRKRGRPTKDPSELKQPLVYIAKGTGRGRPKKYEDGMSPSALKKKAEQEARQNNNNDLTPRRGRPPKIQ